MTTEKDVEQLSKLVSAYATNGSLGNIDEVIEVGLLVLILASAVLNLRLRAI